MAGERDETVKVALQDLERAEKLKQAGNRAFQEGRTECAHAIYCRALRIVPPPLPGLVIALPSLSFGRAALYLNRAQTSFRQGWLLPCVSDCSCAIVECEVARNPNQYLHCKAMAWRARAWAGLGFDARALKDLQRVLDTVAEGKGARCSQIAKSMEKLKDELVATSSHGEFRCGQLTEEILIRSMSFLPVADLCRARSLSREYKDVAQRPPVWIHQPKTVLGILEESALAFEHGFAPLRRGASSRISWMLLDSCGNGRHRTLALKGLESTSSPDKCSLPCFWVPRRLNIITSRPPVVLDIGMCYTKAGLAGGASPNLFLPNILLCGHGALVEEGLLTDSKSTLMKLLFQTFKLLGVDQREHAVLLCLSSYQRSDIPTEIYDERAWILESILIEEFGVISVSRAETSVLTLLGHGKHTGVVVDIGLGSCRATPVIDGAVVKDAISVEYVGTANCTNYLLGAIRETGIELKDPEMSGFCFMLRVKNVKEDFCFVAPTKDDAFRAADREIDMLTEVLRDRLCLGKELAIAGEFFFTPQLTGPQHSYFHSTRPPPSCGLQHLVLHAVQKCCANAGGQEIAGRLLSCVALAGGTANMPGMESRLQVELEKIIQDDRILLGSSAHVLPFRPEPAWFGASVLAASGACTSTVQP